MEKVILAGHLHDENNLGKTPVFVKITFKDCQLSFTGVVGPMKGGNALGSCGQIYDVLMDQKFRNAPGVDAMNLYLLWRRWHLNDMRAGSPAQEKFLRNNPVTYQYPETHYNVACAILDKAGLNPDPETGYHYGSAWLKEDVPDYITNYLFSNALPASPTQPAWI